MYLSICISICLLPEIPLLSNALNFLFVSFFFFTKKFVLYYNTFSPYRGQLKKKFPI